MLRHARRRGVQGSNQIQRMVIGRELGKGPTFS
jgi:hypothetical protein